MNTNEKIGKAAEIVADVAILAGIASDVIRTRRTSAHAAECRRHAKRVAVASALATAFGLVALQSSKHLRKAARQHHEWKVQDMKLEIALEDAGNTSDAVASY